jgi:translation initiation factor 3 subunit L
MWFSWLQLLMFASQTRHLFTPRIAGCHISLFYYGGFCYLMSRRYLDAARAFNTVLAYVQRCGPLLW